MSDLVIGDRRHKRDKFFATVMLSKPEELIVAGAMKKLGYDALQRPEIARKLIVSFCQDIMAEGVVGEPLDRIRAELDRLEASSVALDEASTRIPLKTKR